MDKTDSEQFITQSYSILLNLINHKNMITIDQLKDVLEREQALRGYL
jgi:hypothetical protein